MEEDPLKKQLDQLMDPHQLELFGNSLQPGQMIHLLDIINQNQNKYSEKLSPILAGLSHENFTKLILLLTPEQQALLQHESMAIPLQHHLSILAQDKMNVFESVTKLFLGLDMIIERFNVAEMGLKELKELSNQIHHLSLSVDVEVMAISRLLLLAWNSNRIDLIEKFSLLKESLQKYSKYNALPEKLQNKLDSVYAKINQVNVPAIDAIAELSVWCPQDYIEIGLLSDDEKNQNSIEMTSKAKMKLESLGLSSLNDLKAAGIYSKKALTDYLVHNKAML